MNDENLCNEYKDREGDDDVYDDDEDIDDYNDGEWDAEED